MIGGNRNGTELGANFFDQLRPHVLAIDDLLDDDKKSLPTTFLFPKPADGPLLGSIRTICDMRSFVFDDQQSSSVHLRDEVGIEFVRSSGQPKRVWVTSDVSDPELQSWETV